MRNYRAKPRVTDKDWICVPGKYADGIVTCKSPVLKLEDLKTVFYEVDVSINGQQFTGFPLTFKFYCNQPKL